MYLYLFVILCWPVRFRSGLLQRLHYQHFGSYRRYTCLVLFFWTLQLTHLSVSLFISLFGLKGHSIEGYFKYRLELSLLELNLDSLPWVCVACLWWVLSRFLHFIGEIIVFSYSFYWEGIWYLKFRICLMQNRWEVLHWTLLFLPVFGIKVWLIWE
jgi:hypothetical protein